MSMFLPIEGEKLIYKGKCVVIEHGTIYKIIFSVQEQSTHKKENGKDLQVENSQEKFEFSGFIRSGLTKNFVKLSFPDGC